MTPPMHDPQAWQQALDALPGNPVDDDDFCFGHEAALPYLMAQQTSDGVAMPAADPPPPNGLPGVGSGS